MDVYGHLRPCSTPLQPYFSCAFSTFSNRKIKWTIDLVFWAYFKATIACHTGHEIQLFIVPPLHKSNHAPFVSSCLTYDAILPLKYANGNWIEDLFAKLTREYYDGMG